MDYYKVKHINKNKDIYVKVPGSKSITNRALLLAALSTGTSVVRGALKSDDSMHFLKCLKDLGFEVEENDEADEIIIKGAGGSIPVKETGIYVGSAGTAARFLTAMLAFSDGKYVIESSEQMSKRPMKDLLDALTNLGASFAYRGEEYSFPFEVTGIYYSNDKSPANYETDLNIDKSSQYLSALLMTAPMLKGPLLIKLSGSRRAKSYVDITINMMKDFGVNVDREGEGVYIVHTQANEGYKPQTYDVEPDMSAACYFYAMAAANGISTVVKGLNYKNTQGDMKFLSVLEKMGCLVSEEEQGIRVTGPEKLKGIEVDMSDFSDQTLTLGAIAPFADSPVTIRGVAHIRNQECDRLEALGRGLSDMGISYDMYEDGICIYPGNPKAADIETFNDHRVAMSFAVTGTRAEGIRILNPLCCKKTFPEYFKVLDGLTENIE